MAFTFFFIILPLLIVFSPYIFAILSAMEKTSEVKLKNEIARQRIAESQLKQAALLDARIARSMIAEAKAAEANNKAVIQDLNIELLKYKIMRERHDLGLDAPKFGPDENQGN